MPSAANSELLKDGKIAGQHATLFYHHILIILASRDARSCSSSSVPHQHIWPASSQSVIGLPILRHAHYASDISRDLISSGCVAAWA